MVRFGRKFARFVTSVTRGLQKPQRKFISDVLYGMLVGRSVVLADIARALREPCRLIHTEKRLSRMLGSPRLDAGLLQRNYLRRARTELKGCVIAVDGSDISKPHARKMPFLAHVRDGSKSRGPSFGRTPEAEKMAITNPGYTLLQAEAVGLAGHHIPLWMGIVSSADPAFQSEAGELREMMVRLTRYVPAEAIWVFDRGYDSNRIFALLDVATVRFVVRIKAQSRYIFVLDEHGEFKKLKEEGIAAGIPPIHPFKVERWRGRRADRTDLRLGWAKVKLQGYTPSGSAKGYSENWYTLVTVQRGTMTPMVLLSNIKVESQQDAEVIATAYFHRWGVEESTRFEKQGFGLEAVRVLTWERLQRLLLLAMMAYGFLAVANGTTDALRPACASVPAFGPTPRYHFYRAGELAATHLRRRGRLRAAA